MIIHPAIAALRADPGSQRSSQRIIQCVADEWRSSDAVRAIARDLAEFSNGASLDHCDALGQIFADHMAALDFAQHWCAKMQGALSQWSLGEVPFPHRHSGGYSTIRLITHGSATLSLSAYERRDIVVEPQTALFVDRETVELVLTGEAHGTFHHLRDGAAVTTERREWRDADRLHSTSSGARQFVDVPPIDVGASTDPLPRKACTQPRTSSVRWRDFEKRQREQGSQPGYAGFRGVGRARTYPGG